MGLNPALIARVSPSGAPRHLRAKPVEDAARAY